MSTFREKATERSGLCEEMYCTQCGTALREGALFCANCGAAVRAPVGAAGATASAGPQQAAPQTPPAPSAAHRPAPDSPAQPLGPGAQGPVHPYRTLGGFLLSIVVINYIASVLSLPSAYSTAVTYGDLLRSSSRFPGGFTTCIWFALVAGVVLALVSGFISFLYANRLRQRDPRFLRFMQWAWILLMLAALVYNLTAILWANQYGHYNMEQSLTRLAATTVARAVSLVINCVYFGTSVRVRTYMGSDAYLRQSLFNKKSSPVPADDPSAR